MLSLKAVVKNEKKESCKNKGLRADSLLENTKPSKQSSEGF
jgi:hypothetical protein